MAKLIAFIWLLSILCAASLGIGVMLVLLSWVQMKWGNRGMFLTIAGWITLIAAAVVWIP